MRILYVSPKYYPHIGGVEYVVKSVAERLASLGHDVMVLAGEPTIDVPREEEINGVRVIRWPTWAPNDAYHVPRRRNLIVEELTRLTKGADVMHVHSIHSVLTYYAWKAWKRGNRYAKLCITSYYHGGGHSILRSGLWRFWRAIVSKILKDAHIVHAVSKLEAKFLMRDFKINVITIENGVDDSVFGFDWSPMNYVMYAGRIEKYKNIYRLARITYLLNNKFGLKLSILVIGEGPYKRDLLSMLNRMDIEFHILPFQPYEKYLEYLSHAEFFGLISEKESFPQSVNEANAIGTPVVLAYPWGENFRERTRTLIVDLSQTDQEIAARIFDFLKRARCEPKSAVSTWGDVARHYLTLLYSHE